MNNQAINPIKASPTTPAATPTPALKPTVSVVLVLLSGRAEDVAVEDKVGGTEDEAPVGDVEFEELLADP